VFGEVGQGSLEMRPDRFDRVELVAYGGSWKTLSHGRAAIKSAIAPLTWALQVVPHEHERAAELLVCGVQQAGVAL
jgi:hypothetical protein